MSPSARPALHQDPLYNCSRYALAEQRHGASRCAKHIGDVHSQVDLGGRQAISSFVHCTTISARLRQTLILLNGATLPRCKQKSNVCGSASSACLTTR